MEHKNAVAEEINSLNYETYGKDICFFKSGNNIITVKEHFSDNATAEHLLENVIRYERNNSDC